MPIRSKYLLQLEESDHERGCLVNPGEVVLQVSVAVRVAEGEVTPFAIEPPARELSNNYGSWKTRQLCHTLSTRDPLLVHSAELGSQSADHCHDTLKSGLGITRTSCFHSSWEALAGQETDRERETDCLCLCLSLRRESYLIEKRGTEICSL